MKKLLLVLVLWLLFCPSAMAANVYLGGHGALAILDEVRNEGAQGRFNVKFDPGMQGAVTLGIDFADTYPNIGVGRIEIEASLRRNDVERISFAQGTVQGEGRARVQSLLFNTFGEHRETFPWIPYIGAGAGVARVRMENVAVRTTQVVQLIDDEDTVFAWQVGAGIGLQAFRHLAFDLGYRYFQAVDPKFTDATGVESKARYRSHSVLLGARLTF